MNYELLNLPIIVMWAVFEVKLAFKEDDFCLTPDFNEFVEIVMGSFEDICKAFKSVETIKPKVINFIITFHCMLMNMLVCIMILCQI